MIESKGSDQLAMRPWCHVEIGALSSDIRYEQSMSIRRGYRLLGCQSDTDKCKDQEVTSEVSNE